MGLTNDELPAFAAEEIPDIRIYGVVYHNGNGYYYECNDYSVEKRSYCCIREDCPVTARTDSLVDDSVHNHEPDLGYRDKCLVLETIRQKFLEDSRSTLLILQDVVSALVDEERDNCSVHSNNYEPVTDLEAVMIQSEQLFSESYDLPCIVTVGHSEPSNPSTSAMSTLALGAEFTAELHQDSSAPLKPDVTLADSFPVKDEPKIIELATHCDALKEQQNNKIDKTYKCKICQKQFNIRKNYIRHLKRVHNQTVEGEVIPERSREKFTCDLCNKQFNAKYNLSRHKMIIHLDLKEYLCDKCPYSTAFKNNLNRHIFTKHVNKDIKKEYFKCSLCNHQYLAKRNLLCHERKVHQGGVKNLRKQLCPLCKVEVVGGTYANIYKHFEDSHNIELRWEEHNFDSMAEFWSWKTQIEKETTSLFVKTSVLDRTGRYDCHRSGVYRPKGSNKRQLKKIGSHKINGFCPASMRIKTGGDGTINVLYQSTHVGHLCEVKYLPLSKEDKLSIAIQLASNVSHKDILKGIRSSASDGELKRLHLLNKKDLINIEIAYNIKNKQGAS